MWAGTHFPAIQEYLAKNDFDILNFQEVCGPDTYVGNIRCATDCFERLQSLLGPTHEGVLTKASFFTSSPSAYDGNAIFYKKEFAIKNQDIVWINKRSTPFPSDAKSYEEIGRNAIVISLAKEGKTFQVVSAHLPWGTTKKEEPHQSKLNKALASYLMSLAKPLILTGDFNLSPNQPSIVALESYGRNLTKEYNVKNTINPTFHTRWAEFSPGEAIDYIFVSPDVKVVNFEVLDTVHMSDHYGLTTEVEI